MVKKCVDRRQLIEALKDVQTFEQLIIFIKNATRYFSKREDKHE
jgi:hypothetical protein